jgi:uncharacterized membrane protein YGL010W
MNPKIREWFTPLRTAALVFVLLGGLLQIYAVVASDRTYLSGVGIGLLVIGLVLELVGHGIGGNKN